MRSGTGGGPLRPPHVCQSRGEQPRGGALCAGHVAPPPLFNASYATGATLGPVLHWRADMGSTSTTHLPPIFLLGGGVRKVPMAMHLLQENWDLFQNGWSRFGQPAHPFPLNSPEQQFQPVLNFAFFCRERRDCGGIYLQREQSRTVAANLKLAVGSAFRSVKDRADISNVFGRAELWFHSEHFSWFALSLSGVNGLDAERLQSAAARVRFCSLQPWSSGKEKAALELSFGRIVIPVYCKCQDRFFLVLTFPGTVWQSKTGQGVRAY